jgi:chromosome partitioning protein
MRTIAFLTQKGGAGKTTLAASLAVAATAAGERVVALDFDPQASLTRWGKRRESANAPGIVVVEPLEYDRLPRMRPILDRLGAAGFTLVVFDTAGAHTGALGLAAEYSDLCLLPARPTLLDIEATAATFAAVQAAKRRAVFVLNQCPPIPRSSRASEAAKDLTQLGVLAEPMLSARIDYQDAIAAGFGVTEHAPGGRAAQEIEALWRWIRAQLETIEREAQAAVQPAQPLSALKERLAGIARAPHLRPTPG